MEIRLPPKAENNKLYPHIDNSYEWISILC